MFTKTQQFVLCLALTACRDIRAEYADEYAKCEDIRDDRIAYQICLTRVEAAERNARAEQAEAWKDFGESFKTTPKKSVTCNTWGNQTKCTED